MTVIAVVISLGLLIYLGYKGWSVVLLAPFLALLAAGLTALATQSPFYAFATYTETYMSNLGGYVRNYFPFFLFGAIFGRMMDLTGSAKAIADFITKHLGRGKETLAVVLSCAVITYGGVSLFVAAFAIYPIGALLFRNANIPKRFLPACIALGAFTFTMTAIPGSPQIQNTIPMRYLGTNAFAAPILGIIATVIMLVGGMLWINHRVKSAIIKGEGYGNHLNEKLAKVDDGNLPNAWIAFAPIVLVIVLNFILARLVFVGEARYSYLEAAPYNTRLSSVAGSWSLIAALLVGIILCIVLNWARIKQQGGVIETLKDGVSGSFLAVMNTASEVGYGNVIKTLAGFTVIAGGMMALSGGNPLVGGTISASVLAGITGSASGGLSIALSTFADTFVQQAASLGISPEVLHRVTAVACGGLDTLPHNGAVITLLAVTEMTHKESYFDIGMNTVIIPLLASVVIIILGTLGVC